jgi:hypothetical protein
MATPLPYWCLLGSASGFFKVFARTICSTGPKISSLIALHVGRDMVEQRRADEEALLMALQLEAATIDDQFAPSSTQV